MAAATGVAQSTILQGGRRPTSASTTVFYLHPLVRMGQPKLSRAYDRSRATTAAIGLTKTLTKLRATPIEDDSRTNIGSSSPGAARIHQRIRDAQAMLKALRCGVV